MSRCEHFNFQAKVKVARLENEMGVVTQYCAEISISCADCGRKFQFVGLPPGIDTQGATMSIDGLEANLAICAQGEELSPLDRVAAHFAAPGVIQ